MNTIDPISVLFASPLVLAIFLFVLRQALLWRPRKQIIAMVQARGGAIDWMEAVEKVSKIKWGDEALNGLVRDGLLCEGWLKIIEPPRPPPPQGRRVIPSGMSWAFYLPNVTKLQKSSS